MIRRLAVRFFWVAFFPLGCSNPSFDPPSSPVHSTEHDGVLHAYSERYPFACKAEDYSLVACDNNRPVDEQLSCDAAGCHGGYRFNGALDMRQLRGGEGPSCYTCHGKKWQDDGRDPSAPFDIREP
jgi:hypothetical protein